MEGAGDGPLQQVSGSPTLSTSLGYLGPGANEVPNETFEHGWFVVFVCSDLLASYIVLVSEITFLLFLGCSGHIGFPERRTLPPFSRGLEEGCFGQATEGYGVQ